MSKVFGKDIVMKLSTDNSTYKTLVCEIGNTINMTRNSSTVETKCDSGTSSVVLGAKSYTIAFTAVAETNPTGSQVSVNDLKTWYDSDTLLYWKTEYPSGGAQYLRKGTVYITDLTEDHQVGDLFQFSGTFTGDGVITNS